MKPLKANQLVPLLIIWKDTQMMYSPQTSPLEVAAALEAVALQIREAEAKKK